MKKLLTSSLVAAALLLAPSAQAATINLSPSTVAVRAGQTVTVTVAVDASSLQDAMAQVEISYPTGLLQETSFTYAPVWLALTQQGYDGVSGGVITKTAGYPGGFTGEQTFGTATFTALAAGTAVLSVGSGSEILDTQGKDALTATSSSVVTISPAAASTGTGSSATTSAQANVASAAASVITASSSSSTVLTTDQAAAVASAGSFSLSSVLWWILGALIILVGAGAWWLWGRKA